MTDVSNLDELAAAIAGSSPKIRDYAIAQAAATQSQENEIRSFADRVAALEAGGEPLPPPSTNYEAQLRAGFTTLRPTAADWYLDVSSQPGDVLIDCGGIVRLRELRVLGRQGQRIAIRNGITVITAPRSQSAPTRSAVRVYSADDLGPEHISVKGWRASGSGLADAYTLDTTDATRVSFIDCRTDYPNADVAEPSEHLDAVQVQGPVNLLELVDSTFWLCGVGGGGDYGKGLMLNREPEVAFEVLLERVNFRAADLLTGAAIFQDYRSIHITLRDVYVSKVGTRGNLWARGSGLFFPQNWTSAGSAPNRQASWPVGTGIDGVVREGVPPTGDYAK